MKILFCEQRSDFNFNFNRILLLTKTKSHFQVFKSLCFYLHWITFINNIILILCVTCLVNKLLQYNTIYFCISKHQVITVKPALKTTSEQRPPVNNAQFDSSMTSQNLTFIRPIFQTTTFFRSQGRLLYTPLTVLVSNDQFHTQKKILWTFFFIKCQRKQLLIAIIF